MKTVAFFNDNGGVGKTTLVYHLAWMYSELGVAVVAADLDPQANLTAMFLSEDRIEELWPNGDHPQSIWGAVSDDTARPHVEEIAYNLGVLVGDLALSRFEAELASAWPSCMHGDEAAFRTESAFHRTILEAAASRDAELVLIDLGPNLGAINRAATIAAHFVVVPLAPDLFSLQGLRNVGVALRDWRNGWRDRLDRRPDDATLSLPSAEIKAAGYVVIQHGVGAASPVQTYRKWMRQIPDAYHEVAPDGDTHCLATLKHHSSLMYMAREAEKPMFRLRAADGALGGHTHAVLDCYAEFKDLATAIAHKCGIPL